MAHGFLLYGPLSILGPLRNTETAGSAGLLATVGLVVILTVCLSLYGNAGSGPSAAESTVTTPNPPQELFTKEGWSEFTSGFILGGLGGAFFAFYLASTPYVQPLVKIAAGVWSVH
ncbi:photosystem I reaction center subunit XI [Synechococcus elongatus PCC 6301]|nr:photosystem I reaction center subunit XI [Synechococcus elongatus PCC 6301]